MDRPEGQAWLAREIRTGNEYHCALCGSKYFQKLLTDNRCAWEVYQNHINKSHILPVIMELHNGPRQLVYIPPGRTTPEFVKLGTNTTKHTPQTSQNKPDVIGD